ncbi:hypothetical protein NMY22_g4627 [Coprinellus aureogranulatus]|nr:hypothetical protein NMY22_g4627 [Coprinellus aureogranulatus]
MQQQEQALCPELELRHLPFIDTQTCFPKESSVCVLAITASGDVPTNVTALPHAKLVEELDHLDTGPTTVGSPVLQVLFIDTKGDATPSLSLETANYLRSHLGVSATYLAAVASRTRGVVTTGHGQRAINVGERLDRQGGYASSLTLPTSFVWFSYRQDRVTYVVTGCDKNGVQENIVQHIREGHAKALLRPLAIDCVITEAVAYSWSKEISESRGILVRQEASASYFFARNPRPENAGEIQNLHALSYNLIMIAAQMADTTEILLFLLNMYDSLDKLQYKARESTPEYVCTADSLSFLLSQTKIRERRLQSYIDRTTNVINLLFHLSSQSVAQATGRIAVETQRDSASMITIAALTMFFLPATFVSVRPGWIPSSDELTIRQGLFSMDFLPSPTSSGRWWIYPATTIPLTIFVFAIWKLWRNLRTRHFRSEASFGPGYTALDNGSMSRFHWSAPRTEPEPNQYASSGSVSPLSIHRSSDIESGAGRGELPNRASPHNTPSVTRDSSLQPSKERIDTRPQSVLTNTSRQASITSTYSTRRSAGTGRLHGGSSPSIGQPASTNLGHGSYSGYRQGAFCADDHSPMPSNPIRTPLALPDV